MSGWYRHGHQQRRRGGAPRPDHDGRGAAIPREGARGADGSKKFVTAGHCTRLGGTVYGYNGVFLGRTSGSFFGNVNVTGGN
ncbi:hypothetical protein [Streptomyces sp. NPDC045251]|uniref:hypothetical protein n=1 Tax=unclassified Streptomyces TaxID=2593676 RepID=UPI0033CCE079